MLFIEKNCFFNVFYFSYDLHVEKGFFINFLCASCAFLRYLRTIVILLETDLKSHVVRIFLASELAIWAWHPFTCKAGFRLLIVVLIALILAALSVKMDIIFPNFTDCTTQKCPTEADGIRTQAGGTNEEAFSSFTRDEGGIWREKEFFRQFGPVVNSALWTDCDALLQIGEAWNSN